MGLKKVKPTSPGRRFQTYADFDEITKNTAREVAAAAAEQERRPQRATAG